MDEIANASAVRVVDADGEDLTDRVTLTGTIPDLELTAEPEVARLISRVEVHSTRSGPWHSVNIGPSEQEHLARGFGPIYIDARVRYTY